MTRSVRQRARELHAIAVLQCVAGGILERCHSGRRHRRRADHERDQGMCRACWQSPGQFGAIDTVIVASVVAAVVAGIVVMITGCSYLSGTRMSSRVVIQ